MEDFEEEDDEGPSYIINGEEKTLNEVSKDIGVAAKTKMDQIDNEDEEIKVRVKKLKVKIQPKGLAKKIIEMVPMQQKIEIMHCSDIKVLEEVKLSSIDDNLISIIEERITELNR